MPPIIYQMKVEFKLKINLGITNFRLYKIQEELIVIQLSLDFGDDLWVITQI
jgi:hypothetical protein